LLKGDQVIESKNKLENKKFALKKVKFDLTKKPPVCTTQTKAALIQPIFPKGAVAIPLLSIKTMKLRHFNTPYSGQSQRESLSKMTNIMIACLFRQGEICADP